MKKFLSNYISLSDQEYDYFISKAKQHRYQKNQFLLTPDKKTDQLFFIKKGLVRGYRIIDGIDITHHFFLADWFATDYQGYLNGSAGTLFLEALSDTTVFEFKKDVLQKLFDENHKIERIGRILGEQSYLKIVQRLIDFQTNDLEQRYLNLIKKNPVLFQSIPQKHIASYLGVRPQSLSRIRATIQGL